MKSAPLTCGLAAVILTALTVGCAAPSSAPHAKATCPDCQVVAREAIALPVSTDQAVARLDQSWQVLEHSCPRCAGETVAFFRGGRFEDPCKAATTGEAASPSTSSSSSHTAQLARADSR